MKKAQSFMNGLIKKSNKMFKKQGADGEDQQSPDVNKAGSGFSSGEDDDLIPIGQVQNYGTMGAQFGDINDLNGEKIILEDKYYREYKKIEGKEREGQKQAQLSDLDLIKIAFDDALQNQHPQSNGQDDSRLQLDKTNCLFSLKTFDTVDRELQEKLDSPSPLLSEDKYIQFVLTVGFHHSVGSQVEFIYPPLQEDTEEALTGEFLRLLPMLALPDGSHMTDSGYVYFMLRDTKNSFHCISCFRQINADQLTNKDESVSRTFVQKAVVVMSRMPLYGELRAKLQPTTEAFFAQKDFRDTQILEDLYKSSNQFKRQSIKDISQFHVGLSMAQIFKLPIV